jgi:hypothetical protein
MNHLIAELRHIRWLLAHDMMPCVTWSGCTFGCFESTKGAIPATGATLDSFQAAVNGSLQRIGFISALSIRTSKASQSQC